MKVLFLSHSSDSLGGAELSLLQLIDRWKLKDPDVDITVVARRPEGMMQLDLDERGIRHETLAFESWVLPEERMSPEHIANAAVIDSEAVQYLVRLMRDVQPDVVITNTIVSPWAAIAAKHLGIPHVWLVHEFGDLDHRLHFALGRASTFEDIGLLSELVVANSEVVRNHISQWIPLEKITIAYPVIDLERVRELAALPASPGDLQLKLEGSLSTVMVGWLKPSKGQWRLLRAIARLRDEGIPVTAMLVGRTDAPESREVLDLIDELALHDRVVVTGGTDNPFRLVTRADVGVTASDNEAFGRVTAEYMSLGKPVIASRSGAGPELVEDGVSGWLFDPENLDELVTKLREAHADRSAVARHGSAAKLAIDGGLLDAYSFEQALDRIIETVAAGPQPLSRLPNVTRLWIGLPVQMESYRRHLIVFHQEIRSSVTWRVGSIALTPLKIAARAGRRFRRSSRQRREP